MLWVTSNILTYDAAKMFANYLGVFLVKRMSRINRKDIELIEELASKGIAPPVKYDLIKNLRPKATNIDIKRYAQKGLIENAELYSAPLPVAVAIRLESMGLTSVAKITEEIRVGNLDLSKFNHIGPKRWLAIMKWARIDFTRDKMITISFKIPKRIVSELSDMARAADSKLQHPAIAYVVDSVLAACQTLPTAQKGAPGVGV